MKVYYLVYKLTNLVNSKIYIGCHMTKNLDDDYMGSGKRIGYAKKKYGIENFKKEILSTHDSPEEMLAEEARLVNEEFLGREDVYNLTVGGRGSWFLIHQTRVNLTSPKFLEYKASGRLKANALKAANHGNRDVHSKRSKAIWVEHLEKMKTASLVGIKAMATEEISEKRKKAYAMIGHQQGEKNSSFGTAWIKHEQYRSKKIKLHELDTYILQGWSRGRRIITPLD